MSRTQSLPAVPPTADKATRDFLSAVKEMLETGLGQRRNSATKAFVTFEDLQRLGLKVSQKGTGTDAEYDFTRQEQHDFVPNPPRDLSVTTQVVSNKLTWTNPSYDSDLSAVEIWCAFGSQSLSDAVRIGTYSFPSSKNDWKSTGTFTHSGLNTRSSHTYWIRTASWSGNHSTWEPSSGGHVVPADSSATINDLIAQLTDNPDYETVHTLIADSFQVLQPSVGLTNPVPVFVIGQIDGQTAVGINGNMFVDGAILTKHLDGDIVSGAFLSASAQIQLGVGGLLRMMEGAKLFAGDGNFLLDTTGGVTRLMMGPNGALDVDGNVTPGKDYMLMTGAGVTFLRWFDGAHREYKSLTRAVKGSATNGQWVDLPGYWVVPPQVTLQPKTLRVFDKDNKEVNQTLNMEVTDIEEIPGQPYRYRFMANARLLIDAGISDFNVALSASATVDGVVPQTGTHVTQPYCNGFTINFNVKAVKPTATVGVWHRRRATVHVYVGGASVATKTVTISTTGYVEGTVSVAGLTASAVGHSVQLRVVAVDDGAITYEAAMGYETSALSSNGNAVNAVLEFSTHNVSFPLVSTGKPSGDSWECHQIFIRANYTNSKTTIDEFKYRPVVRIGGAAFVGSNLAGTHTGSSTTTTVSLTDPPTSGTWSTEYIGAKGDDEHVLHTVDVTTHWRRPTDSLVTEIQFISISESLAGANTLATGTVGYQAICEE